MANVETDIIYIKAIDSSKMDHRCFHKCNVKVAFLTPNTTKNVR